MSVNLTSWNSVKQVLYIILIGIMLFTFYLFVLFKQHQRAFSERQKCVSNLIHIDLAKISYQKEFSIVNGNTIDENKFTAYFSETMGQLYSEFRCPCGGTYLIGKAGATPKCTYTNVCFTYRFNYYKHKLERKEWTHSLVRYRGNEREN